MIHGHVQNGAIVPDMGISWPDGTEVIISLRATPQAPNDRMTQQERNQYLAALARIDAVANESPGDAFRGADHDRALYGETA